VTEIDDLLAAPYQWRGRDPLKGLDCLGVVLNVASRHGLPAPDPWKDIGEAYKAGTLDTSTGFPDGWHRVSGELHELDIVLFRARGEESCGIIHDGYLLSADRVIGVYRLPLHRWRHDPREIWRYIP
jgi:hypothetical protein